MKLADLSIGYAEYAEYAHYIQQYEWWTCGESDFQTLVILIPKPGFCLNQCKCNFTHVSFLDSKWWLSERTRFPPNTWPDIETTRNSKLSKLYILKTFKQFQTTYMYLHVIFKLNSEDFPFSPFFPHAQDTTCLRDWVGCAFYTVFQVLLHHDMNQLNHGFLWISTMSPGSIHHQHSAFL